MKTDPSMGRYITLLCNLAGQFARVGNNYNQVVKAVNTHLSRNALPRQIESLVAHTTELKALSERVIALTEQLRQEWLHE